MTRDVSRLSSRTFDVLVVGGGIYGLAIAADAAQRGLAVALIERHDFGSGSSFNHLRTIHGGLRYLQTLDLARARESIRERRTLARIAPHAVRPLPFLLPLSRSWTSGAAAMRAGFLLDRVVGADRNTGVPASLRLPAGTVLSTTEATQRFPGIDLTGTNNVAVWHDYATIESDRLTFSFAIAASERGATLANYVEASAPILDGRRVAGVKAIDRHDDRPLEIAARLTINATGSAINRLLSPLQAETRTPLIKAMNLVTTRPAGPAALGARAASGRHLFLVPWRGRALFGTWQAEQASRADAVSDDGGSDDEDVDAFLAELNGAFPALRLSADEVSLVHRGIVPAAPASDGRVTLAGSEQIEDHAAHGVEGLLSIAGTKYTTARAVAERVTDRALSVLRRRPVACGTANTPLPGGDLHDAAALVSTLERARPDLPRDVAEHLVAAYGSRYGRVLDLASGTPGWLTRVAEHAPVIAAQLVWAVREEMATTLRDVVIRRTPLGALGYPGDAAVERASEIVGRELGWSDEKCRDEVRSVRRFYGTLKALKT